MRLLAVWAIVSITLQTVFTGLSSTTAESNTQSRCLERRDAERVIIKCDNAGITDSTFLSTVNGLSKEAYMISMANNFLKEFDFTPLKSFADLKILNVSDNSIQRIVSKQEDIPTNLEIIDYSKNRLEFVSNSMIPIKSKELIFSNNWIMNIKSDAFSPNTSGTSIRMLDLSRNRMMSVLDSADATLETPGLRTLNLSHNMLSTYFNDEKKPMKAFSRLEKLSSIDLSYNSIDRIFAADMQHLGKLINLNLSHNDLQEMDGFSFNALMARKMGHPYIWQHWALRWWVLPGPGLRSLRSLDISYNHIRHADIQLMHEFTKLDRVDLSNNWFQCDGDLYFATEIMKRHAFVNSTLVGIEKEDQYYCHTPYNLEGHHIYKFNCSGNCLVRYKELKARFDEHHGFINKSSEKISTKSIAAIIVAILFGILLMALFLWALRNGLIHRCCFVCMKKVSSNQGRDSRPTNTRSEMRARFAQLDQFETEADFP